MNSLLLDTWQWHDKTYGNTYFASRVSIDGRIAFSLPFQYGYERMDEQKLIDELIAREIIPVGSRNLRQALDDLECDYYRVTQWVRQSEANQHGQLSDFLVGAGY